MDKTNSITKIENRVVNGSDDMYVEAKSITFAEIRSTTEENSVPHGSIIRVTKTGTFGDRSSHSNITVVFEKSRERAVGNINAALAHSIIEKKKEGAFVFMDIGSQASMKPQFIVLDKLLRRRAREQSIPLNGPKPFCKGCFLLKRCGRPSRVIEVGRKCMLELNKFLFRIKCRRFGIRRKKKFGGGCL